MCGTHCDIQGMLAQFGQNGISQTTLAITVHTFCVIFFQWEPPRSKRVPLCVVSLIWLYNLCFVAIGFGTRTGREGKEAFYVPTPFWCWVHPSTPTRLAAQYFWLNLTSFTSVALYIPLFFAIRGNIEVIPDGRRWYRYKITLVRHPNQERNGASSVSTQSPLQSTARKMLWYPFAYTLSAILADVYRYGLIGHIDPTVPVKNISFAPIAATYFLFNLSGVVDVILFKLTRPNILLFGEPIPGRNALGGCGCPLETGAGDDLGGSIHCSLPPRHSEGHSGAAEAEVSNLVVDPERAAISPISSSCSAGGSYRNHGLRDHAVLLEYSQQMGKQHNPPHLSPVHSTLRNSGAGETHPQLSPPFTAE